MRTRRPRPASAPRSAFAGFRFPPDVIVAVRWYLRFGLSYRDVEELLAERGVQVGHATNYRWGSGSRHCWPTPLGLRHAVSDRWQAPCHAPPTRPLVGAATANTALACCQHRCGTRVGWRPGFAPPRRPQAARPEEPRRRPRGGAAQRPRRRT